jgi:predicted GNAT family N-acyltransferase
MSSPIDRTRFAVRHADWDLDGAALRSIRQAVFVEEQGVPEALEWDEWDGQAIHLLAIAGTDGDGPPGTPVGTARLLPTGQIGRMAVLPHWRGRGIGTALLRELLALSAQGGRPPPFLNAQVGALPFYLREGFRPVGAVFEEARIAHRRMVLAETGSGRPVRMPPDPCGQTPAPSVPVLRRAPAPVALEGRSSIRSAGVRMATQASREICLLTRDLDPSLYDDPEFVDALRRLAVRRRDLPIKILVFDDAAVARGGHRLLPLIHRLTSRIAVRKVGEVHRERIDAFLLVDEAGYILRPHADVYQATADFGRSVEGRHLRAEFQQLWEQAEPCPDLRRLHL